MNLLDFSSVFVIAYLDPGTGSLIIQLLFGTIVGILVLFRGWIVTFLGAIGIHLGKKNEDEDDDVLDVDQSNNQSEKQ